MPRKKRLRINFKMIIPIIILLGVIYFFRPWFHGSVMFFYKNPIFIELVVVWILLKRFVFKIGRTEVDFFTGVSVKRIGISIGSILLLFLFFSFGSFFASIITQLHLVDELDYNKIDALSETEENLRLMPFDVAYRYSKDSLQLSQYKLGTGNIALIDGSLSWVFPLVPDGTVLEFLIKNKGIIYVDATTQERTSEMVQKDLEIGQGMQIFDNLWWNIYKEKYLVDLDYPYYLPYDGEIYTVVSAISYDFKSKFGLVYTVPRFDGVFLIDSKGEIEFLEPEEAAENKILKGNRIFPENLARFYIDSYVYNNGIINRFFIREDLIDIQDVSARNKQPFLMDTSVGLKWFVSAEPYGESYGIFKIFLIDAVSGDIDMYELPIDETLTGPIKAMDFVRKSNPVVDWNRFMMVEPLPFITNEVLYWKVVVIPRDAAGIAYQAFIDSRTNDVIEVKTDKEIENFVKIGVKVEVVEEGEEDIKGKIREKLEEIGELIEKLE